MMYCRMLLRNGCDAMEKTAKIYIAGHTGLVGSAIVRVLKSEGYENLILRTHKELDLTRQMEVEGFFAQERPEYVFIAAGLVGGIKANSDAPADFYYENMQIANNLIWSAHKINVKKLLYLGSACMYPKDCEQPMKETSVLSGYPEVTNEGYALAKICGTRLCSYLYKQYGKNFISAIPANAYGIGDCFDQNKSHVIPALLLKYHKAKINGEKQVVLWGTGKARREFINTTDIANASLYLMNYYSDEKTINIGTGEEVSIMELSQMIKQVVGFSGDIICDLTRPDGMPRRMLDSSAIYRLGWSPKVSLEDGLKELYNAYLNN